MSYLRSPLFLLVAAQVPLASTTAARIGRSSMKHPASTLWLLSALLLCGCGGGQRTSGSTSGFTSSPPSNPPPPAASSVSNWQFSTTPKVAGTPAIALAGSISQSGSSVSGAVHVSGSNCFDPLTTVGLTGTLTGGNVSLTSTSVSGQVMTFSGAMTNSTFTGTYSINGGCAGGEQGEAAGMIVPSITYGAASNQLSGTFTASGGQAFDVLADVTQSSSASSEGSFGITGTVTFHTSCFSSGTITSGTFPSGSYIVGSSVTLEIATGNGTVTFLGTANAVNLVDLGSGAGGQFSGTYTVSGGACDQSGTAVLVVPGKWDY